MARLVRFPGRRQAEEPSRFHGRVGVDLGELCPTRPITLEELSGRVIAIDAYNTLYQFLAIIRGPDGTPLRDDQGRVTSHLTGLFNRVANFVEAGIEPVFVFDGAPHPLKLKTIEERQRIKRKAIREYEVALKEGDLATARSKAMQTSTLSREMVEQAHRLLQLLGIPFFTAPADGEAMASQMSRNGDAYAVSSQDYDSILYGAPRLVRNLAVTGRRKIPGRAAWTDVSPELLDPDAALAEAGVTRDQLIDVAILIGTDFNPGVVGIGPKTALKLVKEHGSLDEILGKMESATGGVWERLRAGREALKDSAVIRRIFLDPPSAGLPRIAWGRLDPKGVMDLLVGEHRFSEERVKNALERYKSAPVYRKQKSLAEYF